jgi:hypothetical protein
MVRKFKAGTRLSMRDLKALPYGSVVTHRGQRHFKSHGLDADIVTDSDGHWTFIDRPGSWTLRWKTCVFVC